jgi:hypothetical protein
MNMFAKLKTVLKKKAYTKSSVGKYKNDLLYDVCRLLGC